MVLVSSTDRVERSFRMRTRGYNYRAWQIVEAPVGSLVDDNHADYYKETLQTLCPCGTLIKVPQRDLRCSARTYETITNGGNHDLSLKDRPKKESFKCPGRSATTIQSFTAESVTVRCAESTTLTV